MSSTINASNTGFGGIVSTGDSSGQLQLQTASTTAVTIDASQNVGIGTTSPATKLAVSGETKLISATQSILSFGNSVSATYAKLEYDDTTGNFNLNNPRPYPIRFLTNDTERMRIDSSGNVLVGTTTALANTAKIQIANGTSRAITTAGSSGDVSSEVLRIGKFDNNSTTSQLFIRFTINNDNAGSGQINANGASACAFGSYSDIILKENIEPLPSQLNNIMALKPSEFDFKDGSGHQIGFIAQEMQEVYPDVVSPDENGLLMVTGWSKTEARLVKAIQEQQTIINDLKARIETLEAK